MTAIQTWIRANCRLAKDKFYWPRSRVSARDYLKFHQEWLGTGQMDVPLLRKMISDVVPMMDYVIQNSYLRHFPSHGKGCNKCGETMDFAEANEPVPEWSSPELHQEMSKKHISGYWQCPACGSTEGWDETLGRRTDDQGRWMYTDAHEFLEGKRAQMMLSKDPGEAHAAFESVMQFAHGSGRQSNWFIEGGTVTIDKVREMSLPGVSTMFK